MNARMSDVAARAGVSSQTVSRVLRGEQWVAEATATRVRQAMQELGYHGNEVAGALKRGRTRTLGLLFPLHTMSIWSDVAAGAESFAHQCGYSLLLCDTGDSIEKEAANLSLLLSHRVAGIVYVEPRCQPATHPACAALIASRLPLVVLSAQLDDLPAAHVRTDDWRAGYVAVRHLIDLGRRSVRVVANGLLDDRYPGSATPTIHVEDRIAGARRALAEGGFGTDDVPTLVVPNTMDEGYRAGELLLDSGSPPDGIFATTDALALGMIEAFRARGVRVPEEIAIVGHDALLASSVSMPALTTIAPPMNEMGRTSIRLLLEVIDDQTPPPLTMLDSRFLVRESTIGAGARERRGLATPLADPTAWSGWRTLLHSPADPGQAPARATPERSVLQPVRS